MFERLTCLGEEQGYASPRVRLIDSRFMKHRQQPPRATFLQEKPSESRLGALRRAAAVGG